MRIGKDFARKRKNRRSKREEVSKREDKRVREKREGRGKGGKREGRGKGEGKGREERREEGREERREEGREEKREKKRERKLYRNCSVNHSRSSGIPKSTNNHSLTSIHSHNINICPPKVAKWTDHRKQSESAEETQHNTQGSYSLSLSLYQISSSPFCVTLWRSAGR